jgi:hypothetical protein
MNVFENRLFNRLLVSTADQAALPEFCDFMQECDISPHFSKDVCGGRTE